MKMTTIATGSKGNCYLITLNNGKTVVLDAGIKFENITSNPEFPKFSSISFIFITHMHNDHSKSMKNFEMSGCKMLTYEMLKDNVQHHSFDGLKIITFPLLHNCKNYGIVVKDDYETFCYMTDFYKCPKLENVDHFLIEVNYIEEYIDEMIEQDKELKHTNFKFHHSLEATVEYFESLKSRPKSITCCHLGASHSIEKRIVEALSKYADKVEIAHNWRK